MAKKTIVCCLLVASWLSGVTAEPIDLGQQHTGPIGEYTSYLKEGSTQLTLEQARDAFVAEQYSQADEPILAFGIGVDPVWLRFEIQNNQDHTITKRLAIETSWLDRLDVYFVSGQQKIQHFQAGDTKPYQQRPVDNRYFLFDHAFTSGVTEIYIRAQTPDPMVLPIYLTSERLAHQRDKSESYLYGILYGVILALLAYNLLLNLKLKAPRYLYYSVYLGMFVLMNMAYTGHAYQWLWPDSPGWQLWANHVLILLFPVAGLLFAADFLSLRRDFPLLYRIGAWIILFFVVLEVIFISLGLQAAALAVSFLFIFIFSVAMVYLGSLSLRAGNRAAKYFLFASVTHVTAVSVTTVTTWGLVPYTVIGYHAVEIGMMLDAVLLAMALADQFRINQESKLRAERLANIDPLTGLYNRRAFYDRIQSLWSTCQRKRRPVSIIILDIDRFKHINDSFGHHMGDRVLIEAGQSMQALLRGGDILARWGGEEFIVLLPETPLDEAVMVAERIREDMSNMVVRENETSLTLTASLGVAELDGPEMSVDDLIMQADKALYQAKESGRNLVCTAERPVLVMSATSNPVDEAVP